VSTTEERSLDLDLDHTGRGEQERRVARIAVVGTTGLTRDGSVATITADCRSASALEREIARLHDELDQALDRARTLFGGEQPGSSRSERRKAVAAPHAASERPRLQLPAPWTVADLMTRVVRTVDPNEPAAAAKKIMDDGGFRHLVAIGEDGAIAGVLSQRDLFFGPLAWSIGQGAAAYEKLLNASRVKDLMHANVVTVDAATLLTEAAAILRDEKIGCLPVLEADRLVGLITEGDFVAWVADASH
jgi:CBS domain-containing protein